MLVTLMVVAAVTLPANACLPADQAALMDIKAALKEPYLGIFNTWTGSNCCQGWYGVSCDPTTQRVADIVLRGEFEDPIYEKAGRSCYMTGSLSLLSANSTSSLHSSSPTGKISPAKFRLVLLHYQIFVSLNSSATKSPIKSRKTSVS
ncbi:hypothetical protein AABB24_038911 [Solanum stoloniferum]|uniref:Leucine-rich repeat-containing N-terminal plant-type domain-containing protein n=1 Tax=Solanum stoloniferum TaxID=62892 RepID=A0ABD2QZQ8_9SOLN